MEAQNLILSMAVLCLLVALFACMAHQPRKRLHIHHDPLLWELRKLASLLTRLIEDQKPPTRPAKITPQPKTRAKR